MIVGSQYLDMLKTCRDASYSMPSLASNVNGVKIVHIVDFLLSNKY